MDRDDMKFMNLLAAKLSAVTEEVSMPVEAKYVLMATAKAIVDALAEHLNNTQTKEVSK